MSATYSYNSQRGNIALNIIVVLMLAGVMFFLYWIADAGKSRVGQTGGVDVSVTDTAPTPRPLAPREILSVFDENGEFLDGLGRPNASNYHPLDSYGLESVTNDVFNRDINDDGRPDRITRRLHNNGTAHSHYEYQIELNQNGTYADITPADFRTVEGAECTLQKLHFSFSPRFHVIKIGRPWSDTWTTPTVASRTDYTFDGDELHHTAPRELSAVCDVSELF